VNGLLAGAVWAKSQYRALWRQNRISGPSVRRRYLNCMVLGTSPQHALRGGSCTGVIWIVGWKDCYQPVILCRQ
jgi:hypothetical protein